MKICNIDTCSYPVFGKGFCKSHQYLRKDLKNKLKFVSEKKKLDLLLYSKLSNKFKKENGTCVVCKDKKTTDVHHMYKRVGNAMLDTKTWLPCCRES